MPRKIVLPSGMSSPRTMPPVTGNSVAEAGTAVIAATTRNANPSLRILLVNLLGRWVLPKGTAVPGRAPGPLHARLGWALHARAERIGQFSQMLHERVAIGDGGKRVVRHDVADAHAYLAADLAMDFLEQQRQAQRHADMARHLEQAAVLTGEEHRGHGRARLGDHPRGKGFPIRVDRLLGPHGGRRRDAAGRKDHQTAAAHQVRLGLGARLQVCLQRLFILGEIDRQHERLDLLGAKQNRIRQYTEVSPDFRHQMADDKAVENPEGMVRDHDQRPCLRPGGQLRFVAGDVEFQAADRRIPEDFARRRGAAIILVEPAQIGLTRHALDQTDDETLEPRVVRGGVGEVVDVLRSGHGADSPDETPPEPVDHDRVGAEGIFLRRPMAASSDQRLFEIGHVGLHPVGHGGRQHDVVLRQDHQARHLDLLFDILRAFPVARQVAVPVDAAGKAGAREAIDEDFQFFGVKSCSPRQSFSSSANALIIARLRCSAGAPWYAVWVMVFLRMKKRKARATSLARIASASPGFLEMDDVHVAAVRGAQAHDRVDRRARQERHVHADDAAHPLFMEQRHMPSDDATTIVAAEDGLLDAECVEQPGHVAGQMLDVVLIHGGGPVRQAVAALIWRQHTIAGIRQRRNLMTPRVSEFRKAVTEHDRDAVLWAGFVHRHVDAVGLDHGR